MVTMVSFRHERAAHRYRTEIGLRSPGVVRRMADHREVGSVAHASDVIELRVPADPAYLAVIRIATAGLAARLDLSLDEIEDLRIAVDEACSLVLLERSHPGRTLNASFTVGDGTIAVLICGPARTVPERASFSWSVLQALAGEVVTGLDADGAWIRLTHVSRRAGQ